jgi:hypothetical protein
MPRRALNSTEGDKGSNPARRDDAIVAPGRSNCAKEAQDWAKNLDDEQLDHREPTCPLTHCRSWVGLRPVHEGPLLSAGGGLCHHLCMAKTVIVKLTDDIDGGDADETVHFALDGRTYEIDLSAANAATLRETFNPFIEKGRTSSSSRVRPPRASSPDEETMYSQLSDDEKTRFRAWADMPTARRISDARVKSWVAAGKP